GNIDREQGDYDRAIFDYNMALQLKPSARVLYNRAEAYRLIGNQARAIADYSEALKSYPDSPLYHFGRGLAHLYSGALADAQADLTRAAELKPQHAYGALWREIAERRNNAPSRLAQAASMLDMDAWPAPVIRLFLGETTHEAVLQAAASSDPHVREGRTCEALFYIGELRVFQNALDR